MTRAPVTLKRTVRYPLPNTERPKPGKKKGKKP
jgi:hypothetical protein